jgi:hypothetical protein
MFRIERFFMIFTARLPSGPHPGALFRVRALGVTTSPDPVSREFGQMGFSPMKLKPESGANRIKSADDAYSFMVHMRLSYQNKAHWQTARQAINQASMSDANEIRAWRSFRAAGSSGRLEESMSAVSRRTTGHDAIYRRLPIEDDEIRACKESRNG